MERKRRERGERLFATGLTYEWRKEKNVLNFNIVHLSPGYTDFFHFILPA